MVVAFSHALLTSLKNFGKNYNCLHAKLKVAIAVNNRLHIILQHKTRRSTFSKLYINL